jgi:hypothetical protein
MVEKGEFFRQAMTREFAEEALSKEFEFVTQVVNHKLYSIVTGTDELNDGFNAFFLNGVEVKKLKQFKKKYKNLLLFLNNRYIEGMLMIQEIQITLGWVN